MRKILLSLAAAIVFAACGCATIRDDSIARPLTVHIGAFEQRSRDAEHEWLEESIPEVLKKELGRDVRFVDSPSGADRAVVGEYWIRNGQLIVAAQVMRGMRATSEKQWSVEAGRMEVIIPFVKSIAIELKKDLMK